MAESVKRTSAKKAAPKPAAKTKTASKRPAKKVAPNQPSSLLRRVVSITKSSKVIVVFDEEQGYNREIRYARGERSIYVDEQLRTRSAR